MSSDLVTPEDIIRFQKGVVTEDQVTPEDVKRFQESFAASVPGAAEHERIARTGLTSRESFVAGAVGQEKLGRTPAGFGTRADLSLSDTFEEKRKKFLSKFPKGDFRIIEVPSEVAGGGGYDLVFSRDTGKEPYSMFDPNQPEMGDVADFLGSLPAAAGQVAALYRSKGLTLPAQLMRLFVGAAGGEAAKQAGEQARGFQLEDPSTAYIGRPASEGGLAAAGGALTTPLTGAANIVRGGGVFKSLPGAEGAQAAGRALGLPPLLPTQTTANPILRLLGKQAAATGGHIGEAVFAQHQAATGVASKIFDEASLNLAKTNLASAESAARQKVLNSVRLVPTHTEVGGQAIQQGLSEWNKLSTARVTQAYNKARAIQEPIFDLGPAQAEAARVGQGVQASLKEGGSTNVSADLSPELFRLTQKISDLNPEVRSLSGSSSTDQIIELERHARELAQPAMGEQMRREHYLALKVADSLRSVLDNPQNAGPGFKEAWKAARDEAKQRFEVWDQIKATISAVNRKFEPIALAESLFQPGNADTIRFVKSTLASRGLESRWAVLQESFKTKLLQNPDTAMDSLRRFDPETRRLLLPDTAFAEFKAMDDAIKGLEQSGIGKALVEQSENSAFVQQLVIRKDTAGISRLLQINPPSSPGGRSIAAGIIDNLITRARRPMPPGDAWQIDSTILQKEMAELDKTGAGNFLQANDRLTLDNLIRYLSFVPAKADPGTSIQAAETAAGLRAFSGRAFQKLLEMVGTGRFVTTAAGRRFLGGQSRPHKTPMSARVIGGLITQITAETNKTVEPPENVNGR